MEKVSVVVYGAEVVCASCVNAPSSENTYDWLKTLLPRKLPRAIQNSEDDESQLQKGP